MVDIVIKASIAYNFYMYHTHYLVSTKFDKKIIAIHKKICGLPKCTPNVVTQPPQNMFRIEAFSLKNTYQRCIRKQVRNALNHIGRLGTIYKGFIHYILAKNGRTENISRIKHQDCIRSPTTRILFLIKKKLVVHILETQKKNSS